MTAAGRDKITEINCIVARLDDQRYLYLDIGAKFLDYWGNFLPGTFPAGYLAPCREGYDIWRAAVMYKRAELMK